MNREQKLRNLILDRYTSLRQFAIEANIPYSTLMTLPRSWSWSLLKVMNELSVCMKSLVSV